MDHRLGKPGISWLLVLAAALGVNQLLCERITILSLGNELLLTHFMQDGALTVLGRLRVQQRVKL